MVQEYISTVLLFFLVTDPIGNLPLFIATLDDVPSTRYRPIVIRESCIALGLLLIFTVCGGKVLSYLNLSQASLELAGAIILFLIAIKMIFKNSSNTNKGTNPQTQSAEPLIVPLAIPFIAGPAALSTCILMGGKEHMSWLVTIPALGTAWLAGTLILLSGRFAARLLGTKLLSALEALMGLLLVAVSAEMLVRGIKMAFDLKS